MPERNHAKVEVRDIRGGVAELIARCGELETELRTANKEIEVFREKES